MICNIEDAGFSIAQSSIYWAFATGFPKLHSVGKAIDRKAGKEREVVDRQKRKGSAFMKEGQKWQSNGKAIDGRSSDLIAIRVEQMSADGVPITAPATPEAAQFEGWCPASSLKPAVEVIICAQKPMSEKTYAAQALASLEDEHVAPGCLNMEAARIPINGDDGQNFREGRYERNTDNAAVPFGAKPGERPSYTKHQHPQGRFPANLIVESDVLNDGRVRVSCWGKHYAGDRRGGDSHVFNW